MVQRPESWKILPGYLVCRSHLVRLVHPIRLVHLVRRSHLDHLDHLDHHGHHGHLQDPSDRTWLVIGGVNPLNESECISTVWNNSKVEL
ncbi:hypothetical protein N3K66_006487 [Trichothecium roseum]|uniref:Uncharacterized protein n=1 Tax=Trichothecium roseum TaxID=47278 RepID=A0ACC0UWT4_9HYPO|nr:hypothetical protein N3K66_006487 [Trichothecium roseum]